MIPLCLHKTNRGFTLVELLVVMVLGLVLLGAVLKTLVSQNRTNAVQQEVAYAQQNVRAAMDLMVHEIRNAGYNPADVSGFDGILAADATYIRIQSDLNGDGDTDDAPGSSPTAPDLEDPYEDVTYKFDSTNLLLRRGVRNDPTAAPEPPTMVEDVSNLQFSYGFADGGTGIPSDADVDDTNDLEDIRIVMIQLGVRTENRGHDTGQYRYRNLVNAVRIRNLGFQDIE